MNTKKIILEEIEKLPDKMLSEVLDFVRFLEYKNEIDLDTYIQSESSLKKEWLSPVEDDAWKDL
ncbi:MAG TPA: DUF2281 domain-containing protein [Spirochaetota bacterium]|nr:DUF2281 domain-containing protein [Spirochaetota bacterium]HPI90916.1 DUF2281 domain-containing protein [Spirochaetota bacterium]HPR48388.1 DUF2281 domain-containing protein [Spirochaetota bacterium]